MNQFYCDVNQFHCNVHQCILLTDVQLGLVGEILRVMTNFPLLREWRHGGVRGGVGGAGGGRGGSCGRGGSGGRGRGGSIKSGRWNNGYDCGDFRDIGFSVSGQEMRTWSSLDSSEK